MRFGCKGQGVLSICFELTLKFMSQLRSNILVDSLVKVAKSQKKVSALKTESNFSFEYIEDINICSVELVSTISEAMMYFREI